MLCPNVPPLDPCLLRLALSLSALFYFPPNNSMTNGGCQRTIYHRSHLTLLQPPFPSSLCLFPLLSLVQDTLFVARPHPDGFMFLSTSSALSFCPCFFFFFFSFFFSKLISFLILGHRITLVLISFLFLFLTSSSCHQIIPVYLFCHTLFSQLKATTKTKSKSYQTDVVIYVV